MGYENCGGKRPGAGRKKAPHTIETELMRKKLVEKVNQEFEPILEGQIEKAKGLYYEKQMLDGQIRIYKKEPDNKAAEYLINQSIGKPKETLDLGNKDGEPIAIRLDT